MRSIAIATATTVLVSLAYVPQSEAQRPIRYPYCWNKSLFNQNNNCGFTSMAQCERYRMGGEGFCSTNPLYEGSPPADAAGRKKKPASRP